jgi:hypothetical protein
MFRIIIPLFHFTTNGNTFVCTGQYLGIKYKVSVCEYQLEGYLPNTTISEHGYSELMKYASKDSKQKLRNIHHRNKQPSFSPAKCFLVLDYYQEVGDSNNENHIYCDTPELSKFRELCLQALRLHATKGAIYYNIYIFNTNRADQSYSSQLAWVSDKFPPLLDSIPLKASEFTITEFDSCRKSLQILLSDSWIKETQYRRVLKLAMSYHWYSLRVEQWEHAYMMLAIAFEAMFKTPSEDATKALWRFRCILSKSKNEHSKLNVLLNEGTSLSYSKIRNAIAHGDVTYDYSVIGEPFKIFYEHVRRSIITLLHLDDSTVTESTDYYDKLNSYLKDRFAKLPTKD